jgi:hypothetical protein
LLVLRVQLGTQMPFGGHPPHQARGLKAHGAIRRPVLVVLGLGPDGRKEIIDFHLAQSESAAEWEHFLGDLIRRGLVGDALEMICLDGGGGLLAALPTAFPAIPVQRCWDAQDAQCPRQGAPRADQPAAKADLQAAINAKTLPQARSAARRFANRWQQEYAKTVTCLRNDLDELLTPAPGQALLALQIPRRAQKSQNHKRYRAALRRSQAADPAHLRLFRPNLDGPHPVRCLQPRKPKPERQHPSPADANLLTSPRGLQPSFAARLLFTF